MIFLTAILLVLGGCSASQKGIVGQYISTCYLQTRPALSAEVFKNGTFIYNLAYAQDTVYGTWYLSGDTLVLSSEYFTDEYRFKKFPGIPKDLTPTYKFTDRGEQDMYLVKNRKLYPINEFNQLQKCTLVKR